MTKKKEVELSNKDITVLVVEDEVLLADDICSDIESLGYKVLEPALGYDDAIKAIETHKPDIAILDIVLDEERDGIDLGKEINEKYKFPFIFLTSHSKRKLVERAADVFPASYIMKPFRKDNIYAAIEIALKAEKEKNKQDIIFIKQNGKNVGINTKDIIYLKSSHVYIKIHTKNKIYKERNSLNNIIKMLPDNFIRVHKSYIINADYVDSISRNNIIVCDIAIVIGRAYRNILKEKFNCS